MIFGRPKVIVNEDLKLLARMFRATPSRGQFLYIDLARPKILVMLNGEGK